MMELQKWKILQQLDPAFAADVKCVYLVGITSYLPKDKADSYEDEDTERRKSLLFFLKKLRIKGLMTVLMLSVM